MSFFFLFTVQQLETPKSENIVIFTAQIINYLNTETN